MCGESRDSAWLVYEWIRWTDHGPVLPSDLQQRCIAHQLGSNPAANVYIVCPRLCAHARTKPSHPPPEHTGRSSYLAIHNGGGLQSYRKVKNRFENVGDEAGAGPGHEVLRSSASYRTHLERGGGLADGGHRHGV